MKPAIAVVILASLILTASVARAQELLVDGTTRTLGGEQRFERVQVLRGGRIVVAPYTGDRARTGFLRLIAREITVDATSAIVADGAGYQPRSCRDGDGPTGVLGGRGGCRVHDSGGGGGHFGRGGQGTTDCPGTGCVFPRDYESACAGAEDVCSGVCRDGRGLPPTYGPAFRHALYVPDFGAAGGDSGCRDGDGGGHSAGGAGGGSITLVGLADDRSGQVTVEGQVLARGARGCGWINDSGGGGAGGTIFIVGDRVTVAASAQLRAEGGPGGSGSSSGAGGWWNACGASSSTLCDDCGGGGGGGIIAIQSRASSLAPAALFRVAGGPGGGEFDGCRGCQGEAGGGAGELQLDGAYVGEVCDGYDNDFDGMTDEGLSPVACGLGACRVELAGCTAGVATECSPGVEGPTCRAPSPPTARPRVAVIFDSSGSMLTDLSGAPTFGDGSVGHTGLDTNGDGIAGNDSRLFIARQALADVMSAYPEIDFALARYHQDTGRNRSCQTATWFECQSLCCSYDDPRDNTASPGSAHPPCTVSAGSAGSVTVRPLSPGGEQCIHYAGSCGAPRRGADVLVGFGADVRQHLSWLDGRETNFLEDVTPGNVCRWDLGGDCELRGTGPTPLASALQSVTDYLGPIVATDPATACRGYSVVLLTDGAESCGGDPVEAARQLRTRLGIETFVVAVSVLPEERASLTALARAGSASGARDAVFVSRREELVPALAAIVSGSVRTERCNGVDDDCDGVVDEGFAGLGAVCDDGRVGACRGRGSVRCRADGTGTECVITAPGASPGTEVCNGVDDDCDGRVDEGLSCGPSCTPTGEEVCNGVDDDCDGAVDEADPRLGAPCGTSVGLCRAGTLRCVRGALVCSGETTGRAETCNGLDDDCDGATDDEARCPGATRCEEGACRTPCDATLEFPCAPGYECVLRGGVHVCLPTPCAACTGGQVCRGDRCVDPCDGVQCAEGQTCERGICRDCTTLGCPQGQLCHGARCVVDRCATVTCPSGAGCHAGRCVPVCDDRLCAEGTRCDASGRCVSDPCHGRRCTSSDAGVTACVAGRCVSDPCATARCNPGQACVTERGCVAEPCGLSRCPAGYVCRALPDGSPACGVDGAVTRAQVERVVGTGGGGMDCDARPGAPGAPGALGVALVALGLALAVRRRARALVAPWAAAVLGCVADPYTLTGLDASLADRVAPTDGSDANDRRDTRPACFPTDAGELCNGRDDNCDGRVDEGYDFQSDPRHCGGCERPCLATNAEVACEGGRCRVTACLPGYRDLDTEAGCEYRCPVFPALVGERCDGVDEDCDGRVDEAEDLEAPPSELCRTTAATPCAAVRAVCATRGGRTGWYCDYPSSVEADPLVPNGIVLEERRCDGLDGDCDGVADDAFSGLGAGCDNGLLGACRDEGVVRCDPADATRTRCDFTAGPDPVPGAPTREVCNAVDDNCDGIVDNPRPDDPARVVDEMVSVRVGAREVWVYRYEATRPDATATSGGASSARACSRAGALPWTTVGYEAARAACQAAGRRLCTGEEWAAACGAVYPYGATYRAEVCNGADFDGISGGTVDHVLLPTGAAGLSGCVTAAGVHDLSGNVKEWTDDRRGDTGAPRNTPIYVVRGGSFESPERGLTCGTELSRATADTALGSLGFRCCSDVAP